MNLQSIVFITVVTCALTSSFPADQQCADLSVFEGWNSNILKLVKEYYNKNPGKNVLISPQMGTYLMLASAYEGSDRTTLEELAAVMGTAQDGRRSAFEKTETSEPHTNPVVPTLVNCTWTNHFWHGKTMNEKFHTGYDKNILTPLMHNQNDVRYAYYSPMDIEAISLPCQSIKQERLMTMYQMIFLLPQNADSLPTMINNLTLENVKKIIESMEMKKVDFKVPTMNIKWSGSFINRSLSELGVEKLFHKPNLNNMLSPGKSIRVADLQITAAMQIFEDGIIANSTVPAPPNLHDSFDAVLPSENVTQFNINRPFVALLYSCSLGIISFAAAVHIPQELE